MGDLFSNQRLCSSKALWAYPIEGEESAPGKRTIHAALLQLHQPTSITRVGFRKARGYHKCGSRQDLDWVRSFRVMNWNDGKWEEILREQDVTYQEGEDLKWFDLKDLKTGCLMVEIRRCGVDDWWPAWQFAEDSVVIEGEESEGLISPRNESLLSCEEISLDGLPDGVSAEVFDGQVRFRSSQLEVGFHLTRAGMSYLALDQEGNGKTSTNLVTNAPGNYHQGIMLHPMNLAPVAAPILRYAVSGTTRVIGPKIIYDVRLDDVDQQYQIEWTVGDGRLDLRILRKADKALYASRSSAWQFTFKSTSSPTHVISSLLEGGEMGLVPLPVILHAPRYGSLRIDSESKDLQIRSNAIRVADMSTLELKLGEVAQPNGEYYLPSGEYEASVSMELVGPELSLKPETPPAVSGALRKTLFTAFSFRSDNATLANNGISLNCPICMDTWSALAVYSPSLLPHVPAMDLVRISLERWLGGGPGYTSGPLIEEGVIHLAEDEYLMTGTACLLGLADYIENSGTAEWVKTYEKPIRNRLEQMKRRDLDGDGLIESPYRTGTSGTGQWSTCWFDVISFGWKDAISNSLLFAALQKLSQSLPALGFCELADGLEEWASIIKKHFFSTFYNEETGWLAGWRCKDDRLHDHAFLFVNGAAVNSGLIEPEKAKSIIVKLWEETKRVKMPDPKLGLPGNLWNIPNEDRSDIIQGYPMGYYQNGGRTHSQSRHFLAALYRVGMVQEADWLLERLCQGMDEGLVFGANKTGIDWRYWDDRPCGYEGLLTDQFGFLAVALERFNRSSS